MGSNGQNKIITFLFIKRLDKDVFVHIKALERSGIFSLTDKIELINKFFFKRNGSKSYVYKKSLIFQGFFLRMS